jgi:hypothetical protein
VAMAANQTSQMVLLRIADQNAGVEKKMLR